MKPEPITEELSRYVRERIARFEDEAEPVIAARHAAIVAAFGVLPVLFDWGMTVGLTPDGRFVLRSDDGDFEGLRRVEDPMAIRAALGSARLRYPPLAALIPPRPANAPDCAHCDGSGRIRIPGVPENVVCPCDGLGWIDPPPSPRRLGWARRLTSWIGG